MNTDIDKTYSSAFFYLYNIKRIRKYAAALVHAFITSRGDYCNIVFITAFLVISFISCNEF